MRDYIERIDPPPIPVFTPPRQVAPVTRAHNLESLQRRDLLRDFVHGAETVRIKFHRRRRRRPALRFSRTCHRRRRRRRCLRRLKSKLISFFGGDDGVHAVQRHAAVVPDDPPSPVGVRQTLVVCGNTMKKQNETLTTTRIESSV